MPSVTLYSMFLDWIDDEEAKNNAKKDEKSPLGKGGGGGFGLEKEDKGGFLDFMDDLGEKNKHVPLDKGENRGIMSEEDDNLRKSILFELNPAQADAAQQVNGPMLILAGAGSGKTKCLTHRIAYLMASGIPGNQILAVTFTNKAAKEMKERVEKLLGSLPMHDLGFRTPTMGTFHSICVRILRKEVEKLEMLYNSRFVIFDGDDSEKLIKGIMKDLGYDTAIIKPRAVKSHISSAKNALKTPEMYRASADENKFSRATYAIYKMYQKKLVEHNAMDFDDLLYYVAELFTNPKYEAVLAKFQSRWKYILVDEYQDTNHTQYALVKNLASKFNNLCVIGDDAQSIYSFRGADFTNILNFEADYPNAKVVKLEQNYRSSAHILESANSVIGHNQNQRKKALWTDQKDGEKVKIVNVMSERAEGQAIAKTIKDLQREKDMSLSDMVVLYRMNAQSRGLEEAFMREGIAYGIVGGTRFFDRKEIKDMMAYLRLCYNVRDDLALLRVINTPRRGIGNTTLEVLKAHANSYSLSIYECLTQIAQMDDLNNGTKRKLAKFREDMEWIKEEIEKRPLMGLLDRILERTEYLKWLEDGTEEGKGRQDNVKELFSVAARYESADDPLASFLEGISLMSDIDNYDNEADKVTMMTMHGAKGLEWPVVFCPGWEEGVFPGSRAMYSPDDLEEERRLAYVAITRAKEQLFIYHAKQRTMFGKTNYSSPSKFIGEINPNAAEHVRQGGLGGYGGFSSSNRSQNVPKKPITAPSVFKSKQGMVFGVEDNLTDYATGQKVEHSGFGQGTIISVNGDVLTIAFAGRGLKKVVASVAPIKRI